MKHKRKIYLINSGFQLKVSFYVCLITLISSMIYPWTIFDLITGFSSFISDKYPLEANAMISKKSDLLTVLALWQIGFIGLIFITCILISHKIAGPMFKLQRYLESFVKEGRVDQKLSFRDGDYFHEVAQTINETISYLEEKKEEDYEYIDEIKAYLKNLEIIVPNDKKIILNEIVEKLSDMQSRINDKQ